MTIVDNSAVASVVGVDVQYVPTTGGAAQVLPQRIGVFAQGQTGFTFPSTKAQFTSAGAAGAIYGFRSAIYLALREFFPVNGDGVGTIPVTVYPLGDAAGATAASGDITPSGTATVAAQYQLRIGGVLSNPFVIPAGAVNVNATLAAIGQALAPILHIPVTTTYAYSGVPTASAITGTGNGTLTSLTAPGAALPGAWTLVLNTAVVNGGVWTLTDPNGSIVSSSLTQTVGASAATVFTVGGLQFTVTDGSTDFAVGDKFTITVAATKANFTAAWKGTSGNAIKIEVIMPANTGVSFAVTNMAGGLVDPDPTVALGQIGNVWETMLLNGLPIANTQALDVYQTYGEGRWGSTTKKPLVVFTGNIHSTLATATAVSSLRTTDRINVALAAPGSPSLPIVVAAAELARIAVVANNDPARDYNGQPARTLIPGLDSVQFDWPTRDASLKAGCSTIEVVDGVINVEDVVTFYAPTGEIPPSYRHLKDIVRLQTIVFNFNIEFSKVEWKSAPLIPDNQPTVNPNARKPKQAKAAACGILDALALAAIISDPATSKKNTTAVINSTNQNRLDLTVPFKLSGNTKIKNVLLQFSFFFGTAPIL